VGRAYFSVLALLAATVPGFAADLGNPPPIKSPALPTTVFSWTGVYIGGQVGGGWSNFSAIDPTAPAAGSTSVQGNGFLGGGQLGFNYQIANVVLGAEGTYSWAGIKISDGGPFGGGPGLTVVDKNDYVATAAGRVGYAFDRVLIFSKGGAAWTRDKLDANDGLGGTASGSFNRTGWMVGAGVEYAFVQNWSIKLEYDFLRFGQINEQPITTGGLSASPALVRLDMQTATVGLDYHF
jgi:outer membrane immunogenic protein